MLKNDWIDYIHKRIGLDPIVLSEEYDKNYNPQLVHLTNSVKGTEFSLSADDFFKELDDKLIIVENGALFINQTHKRSILSYGIESSLGVRKAYKNKMFAAKEVKDFIVENRYNKAQGNTKIGINTLYGLHVNLFTKYYNYDIASSITARGRGTVTMNGLTLEFTLGSYRPYNVLALLDFIENASHKTVPIDVLFMCKNPTIDELMDHILIDKKDTHYGREIILKKLMSLTDDQRKMVYYTGNMRAVSELPVIKQIMTDILIQQNSVYKQTENLEPKFFKDILYLDAPKPPKTIKDLLDEFHRILDSLLPGYYWYEGDIDENGNVRMNPEDTFRYIQREVVITTDTDSLIYTLVRTSDILFDGIDVLQLTKDMDVKFREYVQMTIVISIMSLLIAKGLERYTEFSRIPQNFRRYILYKQEFLFPSFQTTAGAKNYMAILAVQEGVYLSDEPIELKGLSLKKSNFNKFLSDKAKKLVIDMIARVETPDVKAIFNEINQTRSDIKNYFRQKNNLDIFTVSKLKHGYDSKDLNKSDYRYKAVENYNMIFGGEINLPGAFLICKLDLKDKDELIMESYPKEYEKMLEIVELRIMRGTLNSVNNRAIKYWGDNIPERVKDVLDEMYAIDNSEDLKELVRTTKLAYKTQDIDPKEKEWFDKLSVSKITIADITNIAIPLESEQVPELITDYVDIADVAVYENLIAVIIAGLGFVVARNAASSGRQIVHNIINYY